MREGIAEIRDVVHDVAQQLAHAMLGVVVLAQCGEVAEHLASGAEFEQPSHSHDDILADAQQHPVGDADPEKVKEELADVLAYALLLSDAYGFDIRQIVLDKIARNEEKYPIDKARGSAKKYNEL